MKIRWITVFYFSVVMLLVSLLYPVHTSFAASSGCSPGCEWVDGKYYCCSSFVPGTRIVTNEEGATKIIESLQVGDDVLSFDESTLRVRKNKVVWVVKYPVRAYITVETQGNHRVQTTDRHPFYIGGDYISPIPGVPVGYKLARDLQKHDRVYVYDASLRRMVREEIVKVDRYTKEGEVYNFSVDGDSNYFAEYIAVHNKRPVCQPTTNNCADTCSDQLCYDDCEGVNYGSKNCAPAPTSEPPPPPSGGGGCGTCAGCYPDTGGCPSDYPSNAGQGSCSSGNHACCQPACPGGGGSSETCLGQPKPSNCCNSWCRGSQNCYQQESGWWCEDAGWVCEGNANSWSACSPSCGNGQQTNECGSTRSCYTFCCDANAWGAWSSCSGSPATKSRVNQCGTPQSTSCTGSIQARAVKVNVGVNTCSTVRASTSGVSGTVHQFTPGSASQPTPQTQSGASYVTFSGVAGGTYSISPTTPSQDWVLTTACWSRTINPLTSGEGLSAYLSVPTDGETLIWDLGYLDGTPWVQTGGGGNVYGAGSLRSSLPFGTSPRVFSLTGSGGSPGLVSYGTSYDFDSDPTLKGENYVSSTKWLANQTYSPVVNYYEYFRVKLGGPITPSTIQEMGSSQESMSKPPSRTTPYYVTGDMTTSGDWVVGNGETIIFIVNGNLTLGGKVNITGSGFVAFIVNGNITIPSSVGGLYTSSTPVVEGIYITKPTGTFQTGTSTVVGKERFVAQGMFMAGGFLLQRDLDSVSANTTTPAELFLYNPRLLFSMPDSMKDVPIKWEEVAP